MHDDWFRVIAAGAELSADAAEALHDVGFVVIPGPVAVDGLALLAEAYDAAVASASSEDVGNGSSTTRVHDFVNRGPEFDGLYVYQPVLEACSRIIARPFRLSAMLARTLRPHTQAQALHVDFKRDADGWTMVGFIFMVDEFRCDNGATRFVPGSHKVVRSSKRAYERSLDGLRRSSPGVWPRRVNGCLQWICLAWTHGKFDRYASPLDPRHVYPA